MFEITSLFIILFVFILLNPTEGNSETIYLQDGTIIKGKIVKSDNETIEIDLTKVSHEIFQMLFC